MQHVEKGQQDHSQGGNLHVRNGQQKEVIRELAKDELKAADSKTTKEIQRFATKKNCH
jgi:hypothetical protein